MSDIQISPTAPAAVQPTSREGQGRQKQQESRREPRDRRQAVAALLRERGITPDEEFVPLVEIVAGEPLEIMPVGEEPAESPLAPPLRTRGDRIRIWDDRTGALMLEVSAEEFAQAAAAHQTAAGLLVERAG